MRDVGEAADHPQTLALGILQQLGSFTTVAQPISIDGERVLHPSPPPTLGDYETFGLSALDASAAGVAIVVSSGGALPERVEGGEGSSLPSLFRQTWPSDKRGPGADNNEAPLPLGDYTSEGFGPSYNAMKVPAWRMVSA